MIISISGKKGSGKNTVASIFQLIKSEGYIEIKSSYNEPYNQSIERIIKSNLATPLLELSSGWEQKSFAYKIKQCVSLITGCTLKQLESQEFKQSMWNDISYREFMQKLGTEVGRNIYENIWVDALLQEYTEDKNWLITDTRFPNEMETLRKYNTVFIKVICEDCETVDTHVSETAIDHYKFKNIISAKKGDIKSLINQTQELINKLEL